MSKTIASNGVPKPETDSQTEEVPDSKVIESSQVIPQIRTAPLGGDQTYLSGKPFSPLPIQVLFSGQFVRGNRRSKVGPDMTELPPYRFVQKSFYDPDSPAAHVFAFGAEFESSMRPELLYYRLLHVIATTQVLDDAWIAFCSLVERGRPLHLKEKDLNIPLAHLHRLARLISRARPKTRTQFLRLISVLYTIQRSGGNVHLFEWNALIDNAGKGFRRSQPSDFKFTLEVFMDMVSGSSPGTTFSPEHFPTLATKPTVPDIITYTTLINIAGNTLYAPDVQKATSLLRASGLSPNRMTNLVLLKYFARTNQMHGVRATLLRMKQRNLELGLDGLNLVMWSFGTNGRVDIVRNLYRVLRHSIVPEEPPHEVDAVAKMLSEDENIPSFLGARPNEITFNAFVQVLTYHGHFEDAIRVFADLLTTENEELGSPIFPHEDGHLLSTRYSPTLTIFRAFFLGFSRHGVHIESDTPLSTRLSSWNAKNLDSIYDMFMQLDVFPKPSVSIIYWIMVAFDRTSKHDVHLLRRVWTELETKYGGPWGQHGNRLWILRQILFSDEAHAHLSKHGFRTGKTNAPPW